MPPDKREGPTMVGKKNQRNTWELEIRHTKHFLRAANVLYCSRAQPRHIHSLDAPHQGMVLDLAKEHS